MKGAAFLCLLWPAMLWAEELTLPLVSEGEPAAGKRVAIRSAETTSCHMLYLPEAWQPGDRQWPVIVEYTGNFFPKAGSTGRMEDAALGYGISEGKFIWLTLPFIGSGGAHVVTWWGDVEATVAYAKKVVPEICETFGGDPESVFLCGFSRGAIGVNYIGLHDDEIAKLWCGFITHDHYDGVREWRGTNWGTPLEAYREGAERRLDRLANRPVLICQGGDTKDIRSYLQPRMASMESLTFLDIQIGKIFPSFPNSLAVHPHTDRWLLRPSPERESVRAWLKNALPGRADVPVGCQ